MTKKIIEDIITRAFEIVQEAYDHNRESKRPSSSEVTRLVFPQYGNHGTNAGKTRVSEQELRFAFVQAFMEKSDEHKLFYSVETPTAGRCDFTGEPCTTDEDGFRSGEFDLVIHDEHLERVCLIEFKAGNTKERFYEKDFVKLTDEKKNDDSVLRYFIQILKSSNKRTKESIQTKLNNISKKNNSFTKVNYIVYDLKHKKRVQITYAI